MNIKKTALSLAFIVLLGLSVAFGYVALGQQKQLNACQEFVSSSDNLIGVAGEALDLSGQALETEDPDELDRIAGDFDSLMPKMDTSIAEYKADRSACTHLPDQGDI